MPVTATGFGLSLFARHAVSTPYHPSDSWGWNAPLNHSIATDLKGPLLSAKRPHDKFVTPQIFRDSA